MKTKILIAQLGSPKSPAIQDVRVYLKEFLSDPRVVDLKSWWWKIILYCFVLPFRPAKSAKAYKYIWDGKEFPLVSITKSLVQKMQQLQQKDIAKFSNLEIEACFLLSHPRPKDIFNIWNQESSLTRAQQLIIMPQFPQYSESTVAAVFDVLAQAVKAQVNIPHIVFIKNFHRLKSLIDLSVQQVHHILKQQRVDALVFSFHGIPTRRVTEKKDEYYRHCLETFLLMQEKLIEQPINFPVEKMHYSFQSRFGREEWLRPATNSLVAELVAAGHKKIALYCPSFVVDCLETTVEIGIELQEEMKHHHQDVEIILIPCLNDQKEWAEALLLLLQNIATKGLVALEEASYAQTSINEEKYLKISNLK